MNTAREAQNQWIHFEREADMLAVIDAHHRKIANSRRISVYFEVQTLQGIADVLLVDIDEQALEDRMRLNATPLFDLTAASVIHSLSGMRNLKGSVQDIAEFLGADPGHLRRVVLPRLQDAAWINQEKSGIWALNQPYRDPVRRMIAIEAKREGWRRALTQAASHVEFADATYVALDGSRKMDVPALEGAFSLAGVGLLTVHANHSTVSNPNASQIKRVILPARKRRRNAIRTAVAERVLALHQSGIRSGHVQHVFGKMVTSQWNNDPRFD